MYYTGIDLHKFISYLTTVDSSGKIIKKMNLKTLTIILSGTFPISALKTLLLLNLP